MIRLLVKLGAFLDKRFPEKRVVLAKDYDALLSRIEALDIELSEIRKKAELAVSSGEIAVSRLCTLEASAVHKNAVRDLVLVVKDVKEEFTSLKASLGMTAHAAGADLSHMLNGEYLPEDHTNG
jgi:hypothetical protein